MLSFNHSVLSSLAVIAAVATLSAQAAPHRRCSTSEDCEGPEKTQYCNMNLGFPFGVCWACYDICQGTDEQKPHCAANCPRMYAEVYTTSPSPAPTPPTSPATTHPQPRKDQDTNGSDPSTEDDKTGEVRETSEVHLIVAVLVGIATLVPTAGFLLYVYKRWKKGQSYGLELTEVRTSKENLQYTHVPTTKEPKNETKNVKENGNEQPDPIKSPHTALVTSKEQLPVYGQNPQPPVLDNIEDIRGFNESSTATEGRPVALQSMPTADFNSNNSLAI